MKIGKREILVMIGDSITDCGRVQPVAEGLFDPLGQTHVNLKEYAQTLEDLVAKTRPMLKGLVLMTPHYIEPNRNDAMRARMDQYGEVVKRLAKKYDAVLVDTQSAFDKVLQQIHPNALAWDRVHPNQTGHMILARTFLKAIGFAW